MGDDPSWELFEIDWALLERLPPLGSRIGEHVDLGATVRGLRKNFPELSSETLSARLRTLKHHGYTTTVRVFPLTQGKGWQRTHEGDRALANHRNGGQG